MFLRTRNIHFDPFAHRPLDIFFFQYIAVIIFGLFTVYRLTKFYYTFKSFEYLVIGLMVFGYTTSFYLYQVYSDYLTDYWNLNEILISSDPTILDLFSPEYNWFGQGYFFLAEIILVIYAARLTDWKEISIKEKVFVIFLLYHLLTIWLMILTETPFALENVVVDNPLIIRLSIIYLLTQDLYLTVDLTSNLGHLYFVYTIIRVKPLTNYQTITITRYFWIVFGFLLLIPRFASLVIWRLFAEDGNVLSYQIYSIAQFLIALSVSVILSFYPEALLFTKPQLLRAKNLYKLLRGSLETTSDRMQEVIRYVESLPDHVLESINQKPSSQFLSKDLEN